jgi:hypothetical protein
MSANQRWTPRPVRTTFSPIAVVAVVFTRLFWILMLAVWLPAFSQWHSRNCTTATSASLAVFRGKPGTFDYCVNRQ